MITLLFFTFIFHLTTIVAIGTCNNSNITHFVQNDTLAINFSSNDLLKFNRNVRCNSTSPSSTINGCVHHCTGLGYGQSNTLYIEIQHDNGTMEEFCFIDYLTPLQLPSLSYLNISDNKVRLGIGRPIGSFDYVEVECSDNQSHIIFNNSIPSNDSLVEVDCSFLNISLISFILKTIKKDFPTAVTHLFPEVPLPIPFTPFLNGRLLTVIADSPPATNADSNYEFQLLFHDQMDDTITYQRDKVSNLNPKFGATFNYSLLPNFKHTIIFKHFMQSMGYSQSNATILPIVSNISYPFAAANLHIKEEFNSIYLYWNDNHDLYDPIVYVVFCNSTNENSKKNVGKNTTYICEQMTFKETNMISVQTQVAIPGYTYDRTEIVQIDVSQIPEVPVFEVFHMAENSITIRWNWNNQSLITSLFRYKINCSFDATSTDIDIQSNEYQCQSLVPGTLYVITIFVENINMTIQRSRSINANTLLQKCQYRNHFYPPELNGTHSVIIEWSPPEKNFDEIHVHCPSSYTTFQSSQIMPIMFVKCAVTNGIQFNVTFTTVKSGYEWAILKFTDTLTIDSTTITTETSTPLATTTEAPTPWTTTTEAPTLSTTTTEAPTLSTTTTWTPNQWTTSSQRPPSPVTSSYPQDALGETQAALTRWRTVAIVALIVAGFLVLATICLTVFFVLLFLRNRRDYTGE